MSFAEQLIRWRRELHQYPELSLQEVATTARIRDWLQSGGLRLLPYELKTGLVVEGGQRRKAHCPNGRILTRCRSKKRPASRIARKTKA
ncbi:Uncharacterized hydrolase YxeP [Raoultella terrigena]|nr:Uncharacterized hydrolase YxeP [Raoultella terrigena]